MEPGGDEKVMPSLPSVGRVTKASRTLKRAKGVFNNAQKIASLARQTSKAHEKRPCGKRGDLLGVVESTGGMQCMGGVTYVHTYTYVYVRHNHT